VSELLESTGGIVGALGGVILLGVFANWAFGPQAVGLPAIIGLFTLFGLISFASDLGLGALGILVIIGGLIAFMLVIGMAMKLGGASSTSTDTERGGREPPL
jgi:hypothetical protein